MAKSSKRACQPVPGRTISVGEAGEESCHTSACHVLEAIYLGEREGLIRYLRREVGCELAPDIAQEVFLRAATSRQLPELANPGGFLYRIAHNLLIDHVRRRKCRTEPLPLIEARDVPVPAAQEHMLEARDLELTLEHALTALPEKTRRVFVMHRFEDMPYREIHRELGISLSTVEYHMTKALAHIRYAVDAAS